MIAAKLPHRPIKEAVVAALAAHPATTAYPFAYPATPETDPPYVTIVGILARTATSSSTTGTDTVVNLKTVCEAATVEASTEELTAMMDGAIQALTETPLDLGAEHACVHQEVEAADEMVPYGDGGRVHMEGVIRLRIITQYLGG